MKWLHYLEGCPGGVKLVTDHKTLTCLMSQEVLSRVPSNQGKNDGGAIANPLLDEKLGTLGSEFTLQHAGTNDYTIQKSQSAQYTAQKFSQWFPTFQYSLRSAKNAQAHALVTRSLANWCNTMLVTRLHSRRDVVWGSVLSLLLTG